MPVEILEPEEYVELEPHYEDVPASSDADEDAEPLADPESESYEEPVEQTAAQPAVDAGTGDLPSDPKEWRRLAYENRRQTRENRILADRFNKLLHAVTTPAQQEDAEPQLPDPEEDFIGHTAGRLASLEKTLKTAEKQRQAEQARQSEQAERNSAFQAAVQFRNSTDPALYDQAVDYLTAATLAEFADENPDMTEEELGAELSEQAQRMMVNWVRQGKNPGQEVVKKAYRRGFRPQAQPATPAAKPAAAAQPDARKEVQAQKERQQKATSISSVQGGGAAKGISLKKLLELSEDDYERELRNIQKAQGRTRPLTTAELLKHKVRANNQSAI